MCFDNYWAPRADVYTFKLNILILSFLVTSSASVYWGYLMLSARYWLRILRQSYQLDFPCKNFGLFRAVKHSFKHRSPTAPQENLISQKIEKKNESKNAFVLKTGNDKWMTSSGAAWDKNFLLEFKWTLWKV